MTKEEQSRMAFRSTILSIIGDVEDGTFSKFVKEHGMGFKQYLDEKENELLIEVKIRTKI